MCVSMSVCECVCVLCNREAGAFCFLEIIFLFSKKYSNVGA